MTLPGVGAVEGLFHVPFCYRPFPAFSLIVATFQPSFVTPDPLDSIAFQTFCKCKGHGNGKLSFGSSRGIYVIFDPLSL